MHPSLLCIGLVAGLQTAIAQSTSLYIPGFDPQPISADIAGVDSNGHTTWVLQAASVTGDDDSGGFDGKVTLVEGSNDAHLTFVDPALSLTLGYDCTFSSGQALCSGVAGDGDTSIVTETETISSFAVELGTSTAATGSASTSVPGTGSSRSGTSTSATPSQTGKSNSSTKHVATTCVSLLGTSVVIFVLSLL
ncbi:hypothetical protein BT96DRAFT_969982 [Gymnopus androsaceus JB14]|uniref:GPI anchored protein n=1 Tax=Gymnopus androsaceus JB14 TaxID=1447944 RepID=A0A6A4IG16_9AGAR|nr:hypothetical protein BT96DRAFT_969982 [Gymnopus androsaceus JB14]